MHWLILDKKLFLVVPVALSYDNAMLLRQHWTHTHARALLKSSVDDTISGLQWRHTIFLFHVQRLNVNRDFRSMRGFPYRSHGRIWNFLWSVAYFPLKSTFFLTIKPWARRSHSFSLSIHYGIRAGCLQRLALRNTESCLPEMETNQWIMGQIGQQYLMGRRSRVHWVILSDPLPHPPLYVVVW